MVALALATTAAAAQNITKHVDPVETFIGQTRMLGSMGGAWKAGIDAVCGLTINAFDDKPNIYKTELLIRAFNGKRIVGINAGSKLILKAGDTTIYLITPDGSQWDGGEETIVETDAEGGERLSYASEARYPITEADLELLKKHGFRKYRLQVEDNDTGCKWKTMSTSTNWTRDRLPNLRKSFRRPIRRFATCSSSWQRK